MIMSNGKRHNSNIDAFDNSVVYNLEEAVNILKNFKTTRFDDVRYYEGDSAS